MPRHDRFMVIQKKKRNRERLEVDCSLVAAKNRLLIYSKTVCERKSN